MMCHKVLDKKEKSSNSVIFLSPGLNILLNYLEKNI